MPKHKTPEASNVYIGNNAKLSGRKQPTGHEMQASEAILP